MVQRIKQFQQPLVSIGVLSYNRSDKIGDTIESILSQRYKNLEILISDDASGDGAADVCKAYCERDGRIVFYQQINNIGPYDNYEFLVHQAKGKYFMWISDDDQLKPNIINSYVEFLEKNKEYNLVSGQIQYWRGENLIHLEKDLTQEDDNKLRRVVGYYFKVKAGAIFYGLMRMRDLAKIRFKKNKLAADWHVVAHMAYFSKIKQLDFVGLDKHVDGFSANWKKYSLIVGASRVSGTFPFIAIGLDTLKDIWYNTRVYGSENKLIRLVVGLITCIAIWAKYYFRTYPRVIGRRIIRLIQSTGRSLQFSTNAKN